MKYIKTYEEQLPDSYFEFYPKIYGEKPNDEKYWLVPNDKKRFEKAVRQVCDHEGWIKLMLDNGNRWLGSNDKRYIFIGKGYNTRFDEDEKQYWFIDWGWNEFYGHPRNEYYEDNNFQFMGYLGLTDEEVQNFEMMIDVNKYNL